MFDYGLTLVTFTYPTEALLAVMERVRPWLGARPPSARWLLDNVLMPLEDDLEKFGNDPREVDYLEFYDRAWRRAGLEISRDVQYRILDLEQQCWDRAVQVAEDARAAISAVREAGLLAGLASNAPFPPEMMRRQLAGTGLDSQLDASVFSSEVGWRKPAPQLYRAILDRLGVAAGEALHVGDRTLEDYEGPRQAGMRAVLCTRFARAAPAPGIPAIASLAELAALL